MPRYRFMGSDFFGREVTGERDAADPDALLAGLAGEVAHMLSVQLIDEEPRHERVESLHRGDIGEISGHIAEIIESDLPLESGLAAIAAECSSRRMRNTLRGIANDLSTGNNLEEVLAKRRAPAELKALVRAGARSGNTGEILEHYVVNVESTVDLRQSMRRGLLYPLILLVLFGLVAGTVVLYFVPQFVAIFDGFDVELPLPTKWLVAFSKFASQYGVMTMLGGLAIVVVVVVLLRIALGKVLWRRVVCRIPLIGAIFRWTALARFSQLLSLLVENRVPLDEALTLAGDASGDAEIQHDCRRMVARVSAGETLETAARKLDRFPASFVHALGWANRPSGLPEVLQSLGDMYAGRVRAAVAVIVAIVPPILMFFLGVSMAYLIIALFLPLFKLLNQLS
jgi:type II secretory pathway component PulF